MARLPYIDPESAPEEVRKVFERLPVKLNVFGMMAHAERNFRPWVRLGTSILSEQQLDARLRELAILRVARLSRAEYEWVQHVPIARAVGAKEEEIEALRRDEIEAPCFGASERAVLKFTTEVVLDAGAGDATFAAVAAHLSPREIVELIVAIGFYMLMARLMVTTQIDLDEARGGQLIAAIRH